MAEYPIIMNQKNNQGQYDILYPASLSSQIKGLLESTTAEAFGLSGTAVPDDVFNDILSRFNEINNTLDNLDIGATKESAFQQLITGRFV